MDFRDFLSAITRDWVSLMSGIASVVLLLVGTFKEWDRVPRWAIWIAAALCFFFAAARVWTTEHRAREAAEKQLQELNKPDLIAFLNARIEGDALDLIPQPGAIMFVNLGVKNLGAQSIAIGWKLSVSSPKIHVDRISPTLIKDGYELRGPNGKVIARFHQNNRLEDRCVVPIQKGAMAIGWLRFDLPRIKSKDLSEATKTLYFRDITDHEYAITWIHMESKGIQYYPGSGDNPIVDPEVLKEH